MQNTRMASPYLLPCVLGSNLQTSEQPSLIDLEWTPEGEIDEQPTGLELKLEGKIDIPSEFVLKN